jgi:hypothetical protein
MAYGVSLDADSGIHPRRICCRISSDYGGGVQVLQGSIFAVEILPEQELDSQVFIRQAESSGLS